jgi:hypothetical protein
MRSSAMARRFGVIWAVSLAGAAVMLFHTAAFAQQAKKNDAAKEDAKDVKQAGNAKAVQDAEDTKQSGDAKAVEGAKSAPATEPETEAEAKEPQQLPPGYAPPPGFRHWPPPPPPSYPQPPNEEPYWPYYHRPYYQDYYYGPPPPPYPPPRYYRRYTPPPPVRYYPEPLRYRPFFFGVGLGVSGVGLHQSQADTDYASRVGLGYALRFGFGVSPRWSLVLAADGAGAYFDNVSVNETVFTVGPQVFITRNLYARVGIGAAGRTYDFGDYYDQDGYYYYDSESDSGMGAVAAVGFEFMQSYHVALAVEANGTVGYYQNDDVLNTFGINFVFNLF